MLMRRSDGLQVIAGDQPRVAACPVDCGLPPAVILMAEDGEYVSLPEAELLRDRSVIHIQGASW